MTFFYRDGKFFCAFGAGKICCNLVSVDGAVEVGRGVSRDLQKAIRDEGWEVREVEMVEFFQRQGISQISVFGIF